MSHAAKLARDAIIVNPSSACVHQIVPVADSALLSSKIVKDAKLVVVTSAPRGMCTTHKDRRNAELLAFIEG